MHHDNACNNLEIVKKIANVRMEIAQLLGYDNFAEYNLKERMAQNSDAVYKLLNQLLEAYTPTAQKEYAEVQALARNEEGEGFNLMPWDWSYYSQKLKDRKFSINDEMLRPYFELSKLKKEYSDWQASCTASHSRKIPAFLFITRMWKPTKYLIKTAHILPYSILTFIPEPENAPVHG